MPYFKRAKWGIKQKFGSSHCKNTGYVIVARDAFSHLQLNLIARLLAYKAWHCSKVGSREWKSELGKNPAIHAKPDNNKEDSAKLIT